MWDLTCNFCISNLDPSLLRFPVLKSCMACRAMAGIAIFLSVICTVWYFIAEYGVVIHIQSSFLISIRVCEVCGYCSCVEKVVQLTFEYVSIKSAM